MMKLLICLALLVVFIGSLEANKKGKEQWKNKKASHQLMLKEKDQNYDVDTEGPDFNLRQKSHKEKHYGRRFFKKSKSSRKLRKQKKSRKTMKWLSLRSDIDCNLQCKMGEKCISSPMMPQPMCMPKKELKKSMKFLRKFHKKDIKAWRKYQKKMHRADLKEEKYGKHDEEEREVLHKKKMQMKKNMEMEDMDLHDKKAHKKEKHHKSRPRYTGPVCGGNEFNQMKTRMMAWFHLLHGQDQMARKAHGGSIKKFFKHVSVKKELREYNGEKCQCMKSAMWQFDQMDEDKDGQLSTKELSFMEQNSLEPCMRPYLQSCDKSNDKMINHDEWCCCFNHVLPPCFERVKEIKRSGLPASGMPYCDKEGYYMLEQCKGEADDRVCWCVDQNGNEYKDTLKQGKAHCHKIDKFSYSQEVAPML